MHPAFRPLLWSALLSAALLASEASAGGVKCYTDSLSEPRIELPLRSKKFYLEPGEPLHHVVQHGRRRGRHNKADSWVAWMLDLLPSRDRLQEQWPHRSDLGGVWTSRGTPFFNTDTGTHIRFDLRPGFQWYDKQNPRHQKLWLEWHAKNKRRLKDMPNRFSRKHRQELGSWSGMQPYHSAFFDENQIAGFIYEKRRNNPFYLIVNMDAVEGITLQVPAKTPLPEGFTERSKYFELE